MSKGQGNWDAPEWGVGARTVRPDAEAKAAGRTRYLADLEFPRMLHAAMVTSPLASARIVSFDRRGLEAMPGVVAVLTAEDLGPANKIGIVLDDQPLLARDVVRMAGERIAILAAETHELAWAAARAAPLELEELPGVYDVEEALAVAAPRVHENGNLIHRFVMKRGDIEQAIREADVELSEVYRVGGQEHAYLEGQGCVAVPGQEPRLTIYSSTQCPFYVRKRVCRVTGLAEADVRVVQTPVGGGFGGKEDYPDEPAACAAVLALATGRPVRLLMPRELDFQASTKRHRMVIRHRLWARADGRVLGVQIRILVDAGAYAGLSTVVAERANTSCVGPYAVDAVDVETDVCYTNNLFGGPFRGFGAPQVTVAHEQQMNLLARRLGLDPAEVRRRNLLSRERPVFATGERIPTAHLAQEVLEVAVSESGFRASGNSLPDTAEPDPNRHQDRYREGTGLATVIYGVNLHHGGQRLDRAGAVVTVNPDGSVNVSIGIAEMGQGVLASVRAVVSQALGVRQDRIRIREVDTLTVADSGPTVASRGLVVAGRSALDAADQIAARIRHAASVELGGIPEAQLELEDDRVVDPVSRRWVPFSKAAAKLHELRMNPVAVGWYRSEERVYDPDTGQGGAYMFYAFAAHVAKVRVDTWTGEVRVREVTAVHDVGRAIHPTSLEGQIQGGVVQGLGWALMEELVLERGVLQNPGFTDYLVPTIQDVPEIRIRLLEEPEPQGPYGAKGIGEPSFIPMGAAVLGAISDALGLHLTELPATPQRIRGALRDAISKRAGQRD